MYKAIIFDLDNTILNYSLSELSSMKYTLLEHNLFVDDHDQWTMFWNAYSTYNSRHWLDFVNNNGSIKSIEEVLISSFRDALPLQHSLHEKLSSTYWEHFCTTFHFEEGAEEMLRLINTKYKMGIISNGISKAQRRRLAAGNILELFHSIVVSDEVGVRKPNKEIFEISLNELGLSKAEVLFIGDSISDDYQGALNAGIDFCFYNRKNQELTEKKPKFVIRKLQDLLRVI